MSSFKIQPKCHLFQEIFYNLKFGSTGPNLYYNKTVHSLVVALTICCKGLFVTAFYYTGNTFKSQDCGLVDFIFLITWTDA